MQELAVYRSESTGCLHSVKRPVGYIPSGSYYSGLVGMRASVK